MRTGAMLSQRISAQRERVEKALSGVPQGVWPEVGSCGFQET